VEKGGNLMGGGVWMDFKIRDTGEARMGWDKLEEEEY